MCFYGLLASPYLMFGVLCVHMLNDGLTVTSAGVAIGMVVPAERQAGAQGILGGVQTLAGGLVATMAGWSYDTFGRATTFVSSAVLIAILISLGLLLAGPYRWSTPPTSTSDDLVVAA
jgi:MFS family permease